jgi:polyphenol oxidase
VTEAFPFLNPLNAIPGIHAGWVERVQGLPITGDRDEAMKQLKAPHTRAIRHFAGPQAAWWRAEQIHGTEVAAVPGSPQILGSDGLPLVPGADGLVTCQPGVVLTIYTADCGAIWLCDRKTLAIGLLHSGKKGTEGEIFKKALVTMASHYGTQSQDVTAVLSPCIRPPHYEVDFAADIASQARSVGISDFYDCGLDTAADLTRFYSYRQEMGKTGRMMAMIYRS